MRLQEVKLHYLYSATVRDSEAEGESASISAERGLSLDHALESGRVFRSNNRIRSNAIQLEWHHQIESSDTGMYDTLAMERSLPERINSIHQPPQRDHFRRRDRDLANDQVL